MMPKYNFCTLLDSNFLLQGLTLYRSLESAGNNFHLYILAFDNPSATILEKLNLKHATIITANQFENKQLKEVKKTRTKREYYWTCTPPIILYTLEKFKLDACTYLDADLFFFSNPKTLLDELQDDSILITEHRYDPKNSKAYKLGKYCVQFNTFKNNGAGLKALKWWQERCNEWCYAIPEDGKFGDQKYLDDWTKRFEGVHELENLGGGVAPWNVSQYEFLHHQQKVLGRVKSTGEDFQLVFYHFHKTDLYKLFGQIKIKSYRNVNINKNLQEYIYAPYAKALAESESQIKQVAKEFTFNFGRPTKFIWESARELISGLLEVGR